MPDTVRSLAKVHRAFYEVLPYYVMVDTRQGSGAAASQRVHAGFDVNVYGVKSTDSVALRMPPPHEYTLGYGALKTIVEKVSTDTAHACVIDLMPFPSTVVFDARSHAKVAAVYRIRITHWGQGQPAGVAEQQALDAVEEQLKAMGIVRR
jgi:hypothetical protein